MTMRSVFLALALAVLAAGAGATTEAARPAAGAPAAAGADDGKALFNGGTTPSCAVCHALRDADAAGNIGPDLDALKPDAARVAKAVRDGFENMPAFGHALSDAQIETLSRYVAQAAGR